MWLEQLDGYQKASGICFVLAKITNIVALVLVLMILKDEKYMWPAGFTLTVAGIFIIFSLGLALYSHITQNDRQEKLVNKIIDNPELLKLLKEKI